MEMRIFIQGPVDAQYYLENGFLVGGFDSEVIEQTEGFIKIGKHPNKLIGKREKDDILEPEFSPPVFKKPKTAESSTEQANVSQDGGSSTHVSTSPIPPLPQAESVTLSVPKETLRPGFKNIMYKGMVIQIPKETTLCNNEGEDVSFRMTAKWFPVTSETVVSVIVTGGAVLFIGPEMISREMFACTVWDGGTVECRQNVKICTKTIHVDAHNGSVDLNGVVDNAFISSWGMNVYGNLYVKKALTINVIGKGFVRAWKSPTTFLCIKKDKDAQVYVFEEKQ